jgi:uncharacterized membrane protein
MHEAHAKVSGMEGGKSKVKVNFDSSLTKGFLNLLTYVALVLLSSFSRILIDQ